MRSGACECGTGLELSAACGVGEPLGLEQQSDAPDRSDNHERDPHELEHTDHTEHDNGCDTARPMEESPRESAPFLWWEVAIVWGTAAWLLVALAVYTSVT